MASIRIPSVKDTYFQHKVLTKIHGQPTYQTLQTLSTELKANAGSVPSTLGGGQKGHLGMLLSAARYATIADTVPWVQPVNPGPFAAPVPPGTAAQISAARDIWKDLKQTFELCQATEKALVAQLVEAIDPIYLRPLLNRATGQYTTSIRAVMTHLFTTHGKITPQQVKTREQAVCAMHYDITQPVDVVFNTIEDLADLAEHSNSPMTAQQQIDLAYVILARQPILQHDVRLWHRRPTAERIWDNMLVHFREAQSDLSSLPTAGDLYHQQPPHQANSVADIADLVAERLLESMPPAAAPSVVEQPQANSLQTREAELQARETAMHAQMQEMMVLMRTSSNNGSNNGGGGGRGRGRGRGHNNDGNQGRGRGRSATRTNTRQYCWSHGACAHLGSACNTPSDGHRAEATFANMMNGSKTGCYWLNT
jgi:hypothetical protein